MEVPLIEDAVHQLKPRRSMSGGVGWCTASSMTLRLMAEDPFSRQKTVSATGEGNRHQTPKKSKGRASLYP